MWPFGLAVWLWGTIFIDRLSGDKAKATINQTARTVCERKVRAESFAGTSVPMIDFYIERKHSNREKRNRIRVLVKWI